MQIGSPRLLSVALVLLGLVEGSGASEPSPIEFNRDVRPILADHCFQCHGPDAKQRQAELRLDAETPEGRAAVAESPDDSELLRRITAGDPDERMPPSDKGRKLTAAEIATLRRWVAAGGKWQKHWSLLPVVRPALPEIRRSE